MMMFRSVAFREGDAANGMQQGSEGPGELWTPVPDPSVSGSLVYSTRRAGAVTLSH
jgi:hypothetical protein